MTGNACLGVIKWLLVTFTSEAKNGLNGLLASQFPPRGARWTASAGHHASVTTPEKKALRYSSGWRRFNYQHLAASSYSAFLAALNIKLLALEYVTFLEVTTDHIFWHTAHSLIIHCSESLDLTILTAHTFIIHCFDQLGLPILTKTKLFLICSSVWSQTLRHSISRFLNRVFSQSGLFSIWSFLNRVFSQSCLFSIGSFLNRVFSQLNLFGVATAN